MLPSGVALRLCFLEIVPQFGMPEKSAALRRAALLECDLYFHYNILLRVIVTPLRKLYLPFLHRVNAVYPLLGS